MGIAKLSEQEVGKALEQLPDWTLRSGQLWRKFECRDFVNAFGFMTQIALIAERSDHHPDWSNVYRTIEIKLSTHEAGGISTRDIQMAHEIDALWKERHDDSDKSPAE